MFVLEAIPRDQLLRAICLMRVLRFALAIYKVRPDLLIELEMMMVSIGKYVALLLMYTTLVEDWLASAP